MENMNALVQYKKSLLDKLSNNNEIVVEVALSTCGITAGADKVFDELQSILKEKELENVKVRQTGCPGLCYKEPLLTVIHPNDKRRVYGGVSACDVLTIVEEDIINKRPVRSCLVNGNEQEGI